MTITTTTTTTPAVTETIGYAAKHAVPEGAHRTLGVLEGLRTRRDQVRAARVITRAAKDTAEASQAVASAAEKINKAAASTANAKTAAVVFGKQVPTPIRVKELAGQAVTAQAEAIVAKAETKESAKAVVKATGAKLTAARRGTGSVLDTAAGAVNATVKVDWLTTLLETSAQRDQRRQRALLAFALQGAAYVLKR